MDEQPSRVSDPALAAVRDELDAREFGGFHCVAIGPDAYLLTYDLRRPTG